MTGLRTFLATAGATALLLLVPAIPAHGQVMMVNRGINPWTGHVYRNVAVRNPWTGRVATYTTVANPWVTRSFPVQNTWVGRPVTTRVVHNPWTGRPRFVASPRRVWW